MSNYTKVAGRQSYDTLETNDSANTTTYSTHHSLARQPIYRGDDNYSHISMEMVLPYCAHLLRDHVEVWGTVTLEGSSWF
jgi:hypothetical protein